MTIRYKRVLNFKVLAACSDGQVRIWNYNTFTELKGLFLYEGSNQVAFTSISFQVDGQKLLLGTEQGNVIFFLYQQLFCWDGKTLGSRNILLAVLKIPDQSGIMSLHWLNHNGSPHSEDFICYTFDGNVRLMRIKLDVPQQMIRDQKINKSKKQEVFGRILEIATIVNMKNDVQSYNFKQYNIGANLFVKAHPYANFICINSVKFKVDSTQTQTISSNPQNI